MPNELTNTQCNAFVQDHNVEVRRSCYEVRERNPWYCGDSENKEPNKVGKTREATITAYWQKYHPDWTPPVIHDEVWALRYMKEKHLVFGNSRIWQVGNPGYGIDFEGLTAVGLVLAWKARYDPDKVEPTREETAVELLMEAKMHLQHPVIRVSLLQKIDTLIGEADHADDN